MTREYLRRRPDGLCAVEGCALPAYAAYARCSHHRYTRDYYGSDEVPQHPEPDHGTHARYRGTPSRPPCRCEECRRGNRERMRQYRAGMRGAA